MIRSHLLLPNGEVRHEVGPRLAFNPPADGVVWVDFEAATRDEIALLSTHWAFHPLAIEDCQNPQRRAKYERYATHVFIVALALEPSTEEPLDTVPVCMFLRGNLVVSVHPKPLGPVTRVVHHLDDRAHPVGCAPERVVHAILDAMIDEYTPLLDAYEEELDELEVRAGVNPSREVLDGLIGVRRDLLIMRRMFLPHEEVVRRLMDSAETSDENRLYYRDVLDHLMVVGDTVSLLLDVANGAMAVHTNTTNDRLNKVMKYLAVISTLMLPMTVISGVFGMNFDVIPASHASWGFWGAVGMMACSAAALTGWFKWKKWF